ncbi:thioredoxin-dependent thiol peroxidase [Paenibacillus yanchengensis]|uniref:thioredoxin-dependent peroxiredoxin n=1 Tax=Paenibacillus yanchengensis TaxID=2035833 RepID=A0ABW4YI11_9BACL
MSILTIGEKAPDFQLTASNGKQVKLSDYVGQQVVLYFYPRNMTPTCTKQACQMRDYNSQFATYNTVVLGVSTDPIASHQRFIEKHELPFLLLADEDHSVAEQYGVWQLKKLYGREYMGLVRSTFLIDTEGKLAQQWLKVRLNGHVEEVVEAAKTLVTT